MAFFKKLGFFGAPLVIVGAATMSMQGCDKVGDVCDLSCDAEGVAEGNFSISGVKGVDTFFAAVVNFDTVAGTTAANIRAELDAVALSLGLEKGAAGADIKAALEAKFAADLEGGIKINYQEPKCEVSAKVAVDATAKCDASVDPGKVEASCQGSCEAEVKADGSVTCDASAKVECKGQAPNFACEGSCEGSCEVNAGAKCEGTCKGSCTGTCTVKDANGNCNGACDGECGGSCELTAGASCDGKCKGTCTYTPPEAKCEAGASASCKAEGSAEAKVECKGKCEGTVEPPKASAECEASVKAEAEMKAECTPPSLAVDYELKASVSGDADAKLAFEAWLEGFKAHFSALLAANAKAEGVIKAAGGLSAAAEGAVKTSVEASLEGDLTVKQAAGLACAVDQLPKVAAVIEKASTELSAEAKASVDLVAVVGG